MALPRRCLAAVGQMTATSCREANFAACATMARDASARGAAVLFLPECFHFIGGGSDGLDNTDIAEPLSGPAMVRYAALAKTHRIWLSLGGFQYRSEPADMPRNTHVVIDSEGTLRASYDKMHLFDVEIPSQGVSLHESESTRGGRDVVVVRGTPVGALGLSICYDLRFPQLYQALARVSNGVQHGISMALPAATQTVRYRLSCSGRRPGARRPGCIHSADGLGPLGGPAASESDRDAVLRDCCRAGELEGAQERALSLDSRGELWSAGGPAQRHARLLRPRLHH